MTILLGWVVKNVSYFQEEHGENQNEETEKCPDEGYQGRDVPGRVVGDEKVNMFEIELLK